MGYRFQVLVLTPNNCHLTPFFLAYYHNKSKERMSSLGPSRSPSFSLLTKQPKNLSGDNKALQIPPYLIYSSRISIWVKFGQLVWLVVLVVRLFDLTLKP